MKNIYAIMQGEYSDRCIVGYTDTEEKARQICAEHNTGENNRWTYDYDYEEVAYIDSCGDVVPLDTVVFRFKRDCSEWVLYSRGYPVIGTEQSRKIKYVNGEFLVTVAVSKYDAIGCERIAQDVFYAFIATVKELFPNGIINPEKLTEFMGYKVEWSLPKINI